MTRVSGGKARKLGMRLGLALVGLVAFGLLALAFSTHWWPASAEHVIPEVTARILAGILGAVGLASYVALLNRRNRAAERRARPMPSRVESINLAMLFERQRAALEIDNLESVPAFIQLLIDPGSYRMRTSEEISLRGRVIEQRVSVLFGSLPSGSTGETYVPVLTPRKGELIDNLTISAGDGASISVLCHAETMKLVQFALHFLIVACLAEQAPDQKAVWTDDAMRAEALLLEILFKEDHDPKDLRTLVDRAFEWIGLATTPGAALSANATWLREYVTLLSTAYPIVIVAPPEARCGRMLVAYHRTVVPAPQISGFRNRLRLALGLRPLSIGISPMLAYTSKSYHLSIEAPDSQFIMEQTLRCLDCNGVLNSTGLVSAMSSAKHCHSKPDVEAFCQLQERHGQNYVHLYMRGFERLKRANLKLRSSFGETPPGTLASAAMTAGMAVLLIGVAGHAALSRGAADSDVPALILALPAAAASWFGFASDSEAVLRSSLTGRCSLILGGLVSLAAAAVYVVGAKQSRHSMEVLGLPVPSWWSVLFLIAAINAVYVFVQLVMRTQIYRRLLLHGEPDAEHTVG